jgi:hypothetical protein
LADVISRQVQDLSTALQTIYAFKELMKLTEES